MPEPFQQQLLTAVTTNSTSPKIDVRNLTALSVFVKATGGTTASVQFEGTGDPLGTTGWDPMATREGGGGAYADTAVAVTPAAHKTFYFDPSDNISWIRAVVTNQTGPTTLDAWVMGEA